MTSLVNVTDDVLETSGTRISEIESVAACQFEKLESTFDNLKAIDDLVQVALRMSRLEINTFLERCATVFISGRTADLHHLLRKQYPTRKECKALLASLVSQRLPGESEAISINKLLVDSNSISDLRIRILVQTIASNLKGCKLFFGPDGSIGLATAHAQTGDHVCVLLGCYAPMILRPHGADHFSVVGPCYAEGMSHGEAFLGSFPDDICPVKVRVKDDVARWGFKNELSGEVVYEDPRLAALGIELDEFRETLIKDHYVKIDIDLAVLRNKGVEIQRFKLV